MISPRSLPCPVIPQDDYLIALARTARADALVSGDKDLTDLMLGDLLIETPRQLLDELTGLPQAGSAEDDPAGGDCSLCVRSRGAVSATLRHSPGR